MNRGIDLRSVALLAFAAVLVAPTAALAEDFGCARSAHADMADVRGYTWTGAVASIRAASPDEVGFERTLIVFEVDAVYAHAQRAELPAQSVLAAERRFRMLSRSCNGMTHLLEGRRYLVSSSHIDDDGPTTHRTISWELDGDRTTLVEGTYYEDSPPARLAGVQTLGTALALVAPGTKLSPTDELQVISEVTTRSTGVLELLFPLLAVVIGLLFRYRLRARLSRNSVSP